MRIDCLTIRFADQDHQVAGYTKPGWYVSAGDADEDGLLMAVEPVRIPADLAVELALLLRPEVGDTAVAGVRAQNRHATKRAEDAKRYADTTAQKSAQRAAELAEWLDTTDATDTTEQSS